MEVNNQSIVDSLSGSDNKIIEHLPYLLQDLWELGGGTDKILDLLDKNISTFIPSSTVLDLCCGKGAVIISIARKYKCGGKGIDLFEPFIKEARDISARNQIQHLIEFEVMDIKDAVELFTNYDIVIYGRDTDVLGNEIESLKKIAHCCKSKGYIIYESAANSLKDIYKPIKKIGLQIIDEIIVGKEEITEINKVNSEKIKQRVQELIIKYPFQKELFENYVRSQEQESFKLENDLILVRFLLQAP